MLRNIISVAAGIITASVLIAVVEIVSHKIYPPPAGIDFNNKEAIKEMMLSIPKGAMLLVIAAHAAGAFGGGFTAAMIAEHRKMMYAALTGGIVMIMGIANLLMVPHPVWFAVADLLVFIPGAWLGALLALKIKS
jgi:hypothetical protein